MTTAKKLALAAVFLCIVGIAAYKALRESSGSDTRNGRAPGQHAAQPPTVLAVLPSNEEQLLREYEKLAGEFAVLADQVQEERVNFLKGAIGRVLGLIKKPSPIYSNVVESEIPKRFELLSNILKYKDLIRLYVTLFRALDRSDRKLMELEERLRELDQTASAFKLSDVLRRAGFFSAKDELLVFVLESSKEILPQQPKAQIIDSDPCNDPSLPQGLSPEFQAALCAQSQLLKASRQTSDVVLQRWLVTAAGAVSHKGVSQSLDPAYYASLAQRYHRYQTEIQEIEAQMDAALARNDMAAWWALEVKLEEVILKSNAVVGAALYKGASAFPDYVPVFGSGEPRRPDVIPVPSGEPRFAQLVLINRTGQGVVAYAAGVFAVLDPEKTISRDIIGAGYPLMAWVPTPSGENGPSGRSFITLEEGKQYIVSIRQAKGLGIPESSGSPSGANLNEPTSRAEIDDPKSTGSDLAGVWVFTQAQEIKGLSQGERARLLASGVIAVVSGREVWAIEHGMILHNQRWELVRRPGGKFCRGEWGWEENERPCYARVGPRTYRHLGPFESASAAGCTIEMNGSDEFIEECTFRDGGSSNLVFAKRLK